MTRVGECPITNSWTIVAKGKCVIVISPAKLLRWGGNTMLLSFCGCLSLSDFMKVLIFAVFSEVFIFIFHFKDLVESEGIFLCFSLVWYFLCNYFVFLEVVPVWILAFKKSKLLLNIFPRLSNCMTIFFLNCKRWLAAVIFMLFEFVTRLLIRSGNSRYSTDSWQMLIHLTVGCRTYEESLAPGVLVLFDVHINDFGFVPLHFSLWILSF